VPSSGTGLDIFRNVVGVLVLKDLDAPLAAQPNLLHSLYGLTPAEIEVANQIAEGVSPEIISLSRGVAITTTRAMLRSVFQKTGVARQSELAALVAHLA
jgi:DNA-binding CsgD family transcriptional regulator